MASKEREETKSEQELIDDYDNMESEAVQHTAFKAALNLQKKKWNKSKPKLAYCQNPTLTQLNSTQLKATLLNMGWG